jgi:three-Cys-motif partner protein
MDRIPKYGGDWTSRKLDALRKYLAAYIKVLSKAKGYYHLIYVDAFAGCGYYQPADGHDSSDHVFPEFTEPDTRTFLQGSVTIALKVDPPFNEYIFIEADPEQAKKLRAMTEEAGGNAIVLQGDANEQLRKLCESRDWCRSRAVVFLDPYGMEVEWQTVEAIAQTGAIDLWWLFPLGMGVIRLLDRDMMPTGKRAERLTMTFGTDEWQKRFYQKKQSSTLFGAQNHDFRQADLRHIIAFVLERLKSVFPHVAENPLVLRNSNNSPLYLLCFASGNEKGGPTAVKIAKHLLKE